MQGIRVPVRTAVIAAGKVAIVAVLTTGRDDGTYAVAATF